jgi:rhamnose utilization protein RhaD (predicted bifunctional aldolase and dehydrogenase)/NAD(P)-dependent dehydrogenase (short-subunit alcohol dehydrogenase family)
VKSRWNDDEAAAWGDDLGLLTYASRLLGGDPSLVLHGGGNSSVKVTERDVFGDPVEVLHVKGSGWDMATIERAGFAPLRLDRVARLAELEALSDARMANELKAASLDASAPAPSVESILHATLPYRYVLHTHADAVLALTNTPDGRDHVREVYGDAVVVVPYVMPGFVLAKLCAELFPAERHAGTVGMALLNHGLFTFADDARTAYETHVDLVGKALAHVERAGGATPSEARAPGPDGPDDLVAVADLRRDVSDAAGHPMVLRCCTGDGGRRFAARPDLPEVARVGPATPDHVLRTKRVPLLGRDVAGYVGEYGGYVERHRARLGDRPLIPVDPAPRVIVDPHLGVLAAGRRVADAVIADDVYEHTTWVIERAVALGGYASVTEPDVFDVEYWELEQAKLARQPAPAALTGRVAVVTGAASGIGRACARALLGQGAAVVGVDRSPSVDEVADGPAYTGVQGDVTVDRTAADAVHAAVTHYGGVDILVLNAGTFPPSEPLATLSPATWNAAMEVNAGAAARALAATHPFLARSPGGGRVVVVGSKNVPAPGKGAGAYSASKAALTQLARVAALEWAPDGIRVNVVHPDAVFDTGLWSDEVIAQRAASYGLTPEQYRTRNLLGTEVSSDDVAVLVVALCGPAFARTTGAQVPIDGGSDRVV